MEFRQLEYFCTISELENFTRTAKVLHVSQPSVTKAIKALEAELGLTLIDRSQKHVTLTEAGRAFLIHARRIMQDAELAKQDMMRFCVGIAGTIHFGVPPMFEAYLFPTFFKEFREKFPTTLLDVQEFGDSDEVRERVEVGDNVIDNRGMPARITVVPDGTMAIQIGALKQTFTGETRADIALPSGESTVKVTAGGGVIKWREEVA